MGELIQLNLQVSSKMSLWITALMRLLATTSALAALGPAPGQIKNLVTFGDSYTDVVSPVIRYQTTN